MMYVRVVAVVAQQRSDTGLHMPPQQVLDRRARLASQCREQLVRPFEGFFACCTGHVGQI